MKELEIKISMDEHGCLFPDANGQGRCFINYSVDSVGEKTATISFEGCNQAFITFDSSGTRVVSYTLYQLAPDKETMVSVNNIINHLNNAI